MFQLMYYAKMRLERLCKYCQPWHLRTTLAGLLVRTALRLQPGGLNQRMIEMHNHLRRAEQRRSPTRNAAHVTFLYVKNTYCTRCATWFAPGESCRCA